MRRLLFAGCLLGCATALFACGDPENAPSAHVDASTPLLDASTDAPLDIVTILCGSSTTLPSGVTTTTNGTHVVCGAHAVTASIVRDGIARITYDRDPALLHSYAVLDGAPTSPPSLGSDGNAVVLCSPLVNVRIDSSSCNLKVTASDGTVLLDDGASGGLFSATATPSGGTTAVLVSGVERTLDPDATIYGLGATSGNAINRRGHHVELWNTDAYDATAKGFAPDAPLLYTSLPLFTETVRGKSFAIFTDNPGRLRFDFDLPNASSYRVNAFSGAIDQYAIVGPNFSDVFARYANLTGLPMAPPNWAFGFQMSRWENPCDGSPDKIFCSFDQISSSVAQTLRNKQIPADGIWLDIQHMDGYRSFTWDPTHFPNASTAIAGLGAIGFRTSVIVDPGIKVDDSWSVYTDGLAGSYFLNVSPGVPYVGQVWPGDAVFPDFTLPAARTWWSGLAASQVSLGVRGIWNDMNEPSNQISPFTAPDTLAVAGDGTPATPATMGDVHNAYALNEAHATYDGMLQGDSTHRPFILSRAAYAGQQRYTALWTGDAPSTWATLQMTPAMMMNLSMAGMPMIGSDVGGYSGQGDAGADLYARWFAVGSMSPFFRVHAASDAERQEPWAFGDAVEEAARQLSSQRYELLPYWESLALAAASTGAPILRPLAYEFPDDPASTEISDEWMTGPWLLSAPILTAAATSRVLYLPPGTWYEWRSGAAYTGGATVTIETVDPLPIEALPLFVREGAIVPHTEPLQWSDQAPRSHLTLDMYPADASSTFTYLEDDGSSVAYQSGGVSSVTYTMQRTSTGATVHASTRSGAFTRPARPLTLHIRRIDGSVGGVALNGAAVSKSSSLATPSAPGYFVDPEDRAIDIALLEDNAFDLTLTYDATVSTLAPPVDVPIAVAVPAATPAGPIYVASSTNGWTQAALVTGSDHMARGTLTVNRGQWFSFKFTRGDWSTVEVSSDCSFRANRGAIASSFGVNAVVKAWVDACP